MNGKDIYFVAVKIFLEDNVGRLFIFKDKFGQGDIPGGRLLPEEFNIPFEKIIERKIKEELGSKIKYSLDLSNPILIRHERQEHLSDNTKKKVRIFAVGYRAKYLKGEISLGKNHVSYEWINPSTFKPEKYFEGGWLKGIKEYQKQKSSSE